METLTNQLSGTPRRQDILGGTRQVLRMYLVHQVGAYCSEKNMEKARLNNVELTEATFSYAC